MKYDIGSIWNEHQNELWHFIIKKVREEDAKDIMQEVFLKLYKFCNGGNSLKNPGAWLYQITKNSITDYYRRGNKLVVGDEFIKEEAIENESDVMRRAARFVDPLINRLPEEYAIPLRMDSIEGMDQELIAKKLHIKHGAVRTRLSRARKMLKEKILECAELELDSTGRISDFALKPECDNLKSLN